MRFHARLHEFVSNDRCTSGIISAETRPARHSRGRAIGLMGHQRQSVGKKNGRKLCGNHLKPIVACNQTDLKSERAQVEQQGAGPLLVGHHALIHPGPCRAPSDAGLRLQSMQEWSRIARSYDCTYLPHKLKCAHRGTLARVTQERGFLHQRAVPESLAYTSPTSCSPFKLCPGGNHAIRWYRHIRRSHRLEQGIATCRRPVKSVQHKGQHGTNRGGRSDIAERQQHGVNNHHAEHLTMYKNECCTVEAKPATKVELYIFHSCTHPRRVRSPAPMTSHASGLSNTVPALSPP